MHFRGLAAMTVLVAACGPDRADVPRPDPAAAMEGLENRLLEARRISMDFHVTAEGAFQADIEGTLQFVGEEATLYGRGTFGTDSVDLALRTDGPDLSYGNGPKRLTTVTPVYLREAVLLGLTRMGILHSLARLTANQAPDHADGGVAQWVILDQFTWDGQDASGPLRFALSVDGQPSGTASLELDADGLPTLRRQITVFPEGEMIVTERYSNITLE